MSFALECDNIRKQYGTANIYSLGRADRGVDLSVTKGELFVVIGPSGCGKSSLLRIIGGFVQPSGGRVLINGQDVTSDPPHSRPTNTVFQNYALFPHLTVGQNVSFGLEMDGVAKSERRDRVTRALGIVGLEQFQNRYVSELSGGQMQRAALARALIKRPAVLLLDEPLGALDLKLRRQMQDEIVRLKHELNMTVVHVTHDQEEACAIADRIAILNAGQILQVDTPIDLYQRPRTTFVADFINAGTVIRGSYSKQGAHCRIATQSIDVVAVSNDEFSAGPIACLLPRHGASLKTVGPQADRCSNEFRGTVVRMAFTGVDYAVQIRAEDGTLAAIQVPLSQVADVQLALGVEVAASWRTDQIGILLDDTLPPVSDRRSAA